VKDSVRQSKHVCGIPQSLLFDFVATTIYMMYGNVEFDAVFTVLIPCEYLDASLHELLGFYREYTF
jgi:hypothetical protein